MRVISPRRRAITRCVESLIAAINELMREIGIPMTIAECRIDKKTFMAKIPELADRAFEDQCTTANPRLPLVKELETIYRKAYEG